MGNTNNTFINVCETVEQTQVYKWFFGKLFSMWARHARLLKVKVSFDTFPYGKPNVLNFVFKFDKNIKCS